MDRYEVYAGPMPGRQAIRGYDSETERIGPGAVVPNLVCGSFDDGETKLVLSLEDGLLQEIRQMLLDAIAGKYIIAIHNAAFDVCVAANAMTKAGMDDAWDLWFEVLEKGLCLCTIVRERLLNLSSHGQLDEIYEPAYRILKYDLATLLLDYFGVDRSSQKGEDTWRLNYHMLLGKSAKKYPKAAYDYALDDATDARRIFYAQEDRLLAGRESGQFPDICVTTQEIQTAADTCLLLMTAWGACIDTTRKAEIHAMLERELAPDKISLLIENGILSAPLPAMPYKNRAIDKATGLPKMKEAIKSKKSMKALKAAVKRVCEANGIKPKITDKGQELEKAGKLLPDGETTNIYEGTKLGPSGEAITTEWICVCDQFGEEEKEEEDDAGEGNGKGCKKCFKDAKAQGIKLTKLVRYSDVICTDKDMIGQIAHLDPVIDQYEDWQGLQKLVTTELPRISGTVVHSPFKILVKTTRTSSFELKEGATAGRRALYPSWNGQNVDPRVRPVAVPRPGYVFFSVDYKASNLVSLAHTCLKLFGESVLADTINADLDPHARLAAPLAFYFDSKFRAAVEAKGITNGQSIECFQLFEKQKKATKEKHDASFWIAGFPDPPGFEKDPTAEWKGGEGSSFYKHWRTFAKPTGLGYPGGLGPDKFIIFARATYKVIVTRDEAVAMRDIWKVTFPEMPEYLKYINSNLKDPTAGYDDMGQFCYKTPLGMHRARADYCAAANGFGLQSPEAEGVKIATFRLQKKIFTNRKSRLFGTTRSIALIHDEFFGETREDEYTTERVEEIQTTIQEPMSELLPGVKVGTTGCISRRWWKQAEPVWKEVAGKRVLVPWEPPVA